MGLYGDPYTTSCSIKAGTFAVSRMTMNFKGTVRLYLGFDAFYFVGVIAVSGKPVSSGHCRILKRMPYTSVSQPL